MENKESQNSYEDENSPNVDDEHEHKERRSEEEERASLEKEEGASLKEEIRDVVENVGQESVDGKAKKELTSSLEEKRKAEEEKEKGTGHQTEKQGRAPKLRQHRFFLEKFSIRSKPSVQEKQASPPPNDGSADGRIVSKDAPQLSRKPEERAEEDSAQDESVSNAENGLSSVVTSVISKIVSHPFDVLQRRYQLDHRPKREASRDLTRYLGGLKEKKDSYRSILYHAKVLYVENGFAAFYKGLVRGLVVSIFQTTTLFWTFINIRPFLSNQSITDNDLLLNYAAGFVSGASAGFVSHPFHRLVQHLQASSKIRRHESVWQITVRILRREGWRTLYRGLSPTLLHLSPLHGFKFMFYNILCDRELEKPEYEFREEIPTLSLLYAGAATGLISNFLTFPLDLIRQRLQMSSLSRQRYNFDATCRSISQCLALVVRREGFLGLYKGIVPCLLRSSVNTAVQFSVFDKMNQWARHDYDLPRMAK